ncbi:MAG: hypothetical protein HZA78_10535 [Candidatus Schekmanbacteria bacterium]|nr:hypothetical protein [Candidatus Schekmanbacteria bacterium]
MGQYGRMALTATGMVVGAYLGGTVGMSIGAGLGTLAGNLVFGGNFGGGTGLPAGALGTRTVIDGFSQTTLSTQVPVPIVFGKTLLHGNMLSAILLGEGNKRLVTSIGLGEGTLNLEQIYLDGREFNKLSNFAAARGDDNNTSWYEFYNSGQLSNINISNTGRKYIGISAFAGESRDSYPLHILGVGAGDEVRFYLQHVFPSEGSAQTWTIKGKEQDQMEEYTLASGSSFFQKFVSYETPSNDCDGGTHQNQDPVEGVQETIGSASLPYAGKWVFTLQVSQATNDGAITLDTVELLNDSGVDMNYRYHNTAYCLINLVKTASISSSLRFNFLVSGLSDNPAQALRTILADRYFGLNISTEIDADSFDAAAAWCQTRGYKVNTALLDISYGDAIELIKNAGRLLLVRSGGIYKCLPEEDNPVSAAFDEADNILPGTLEWGFLGKEHKFNRLRVKYLDESENYTLQDLILEDYLQVDVDGYVREQVLDLSSVTNMTLAAELGNVFFKKSKYIETYIKFSIGFKDALVEIGDIISVTSVNLGFSAKKFRILKIDENEDFGYEIFALEHYEQVYDPLVNFNAWHPAAFVPPDPGLSAPPLIYIDAVTQEVTPLSGGYQVRIAVNYTIPTGNPKFDHVELWLRPGYSDVWEYIGVNDSGVVKCSLPEAYVNYELKLVTVSAQGEKSDFNASPGEVFYPVLAPYAHAGYGGGRWGVQPWGE